MVTVFDIRESFAVGYANAVWCFLNIPEDKLLLFVLFPLEAKYIPVGWYFQAEHLFNGIKIALKSIIIKG